MIRPFRVLGLSVVGAVALAATAMVERAAAYREVQRSGREFRRAGRFGHRTHPDSDHSLVHQRRARQPDQHALRKGIEGSCCRWSPSLPTVGSIRTPDSVGYPLRYARRTTATENLETVVIITDRELSFYELRNSTRTIDYPFTVIRMQLNSRGQGQGDILLATRISAEKATKDIAFENFGVTPLKLQNVRRE